MSTVRHVNRNYEGNELVRGCKAHLNMPQLKLVPRPVFPHITDCLRRCRCTHTSRADSPVKAGSCMLVGDEPKRLAKCPRGGPAMVAKMNRPQKAAANVAFPPTVAGPRTVLALFEGGAGLGAGAGRAGTASF
jgi:hypothetical protein